MSRVPWTSFPPRFGETVSSRSLLLYLVKVPAHPDKERPWVEGRLEWAVLHMWRSLVFDFLPSVPSSQQRDWQCKNCVLQFSIDYEIPENQKPVPLTARRFRVNVGSNNRTDLICVLFCVVTVCSTLRSVPVDFTRSTLRWRKTTRNKVYTTNKGRRLWASM